MVEYNRKTLTLTIHEKIGERWTKVTIAIPWSTGIWSVVHHIDDRYQPSVIEYLVNVWEKSKPNRVKLETRK